MVGTVDTVLVVDDDADYRTLYRLWLESEYEVRTAEDGADALDRLDESTDAVILDREMPRKDGDAVAAAIEDGDHDPFVVMVSGVEPGTDLLGVPVDDYLRKPVAGETVRAALERCRALSTSRPRVRRFFALAARTETVEAYAHPRELADADYRETVARLQRDWTTVEGPHDDAAVSLTPDAPNASDRPDRPDRSSVPESS